MLSVIFLSSIENKYMSYLYTIIEMNTGKRSLCKKNRNNSFLLRKKGAVRKKKKNENIQVFVLML
jgi:Cft2 family RNA processing exonuclease